MLNYCCCSQFFANYSFGNFLCELRSRTILLKVLQIVVLAKCFQIVTTSRLANHSRLLFFCKLCKYYFANCCPRNKTKLSKLWPPPFRVYSIASKHFETFPTWYLNSNFIVLKLRSWRGFKGKAPTKVSKNILWFLKKWTIANNLRFDSCQINLSHRLTLSYEKFCYLVSCG